MGINFSHCNAQWAYSGFNNFRNKLSEALGYTDKHIRDMYKDGTYMVMKDEPIFPLINHSDCDGELTVEEMQQILPQLISIVNDWPDDFDKAQSLALIEGMGNAVEDNESLVFM